MGSQDFIARELAFIQFYNALKNEDGDHLVRELLYILDIIDTKTGVLLTFIGLLIAGSAFVVGGAFTEINLAVLIVTLVLGAALITAALLALSCIYIIGPHSKQMMSVVPAEGERINFETARKLIARVTSRRRRRYMASFVCTVVAVVAYFVLAAHSLALAFIERVV